MSFNIPFEARGKVYFGNPSKPLSGTLWIKIVNTATGTSYLETNTGRITISGCAFRSSGDHNASTNFSGNSNIQNLPAGNYKVQVKGESYMGGCGSWLFDTWGACCPYIKSGGNFSVTAQ